MSIETVSQIILAVLAVLYSAVLAYEIQRSIGRIGLRAASPATLRSRDGRGLPSFPP